MSELLIKSVQEVNEAITALRLSNETKSAESKQTVEKIQTALDAYEIKNQELVKTLQEKTNQIKDIEEKLISMTSASNYNSQSPKIQQEVKAYEDFLAKGFLETEKKYLRTDSLIQGGVFVPEVQVAGIIKNITEISNLRPFAKLRTMSAKTESMPVRTGTVVAYMTGEGQSSTDTQATYGDLRLEAKKMTAEGSISYELLQDSSTDLINEMILEVGEQFAYEEGKQFVNGSGAGNNMLGFMQHADIGFINSGDASSITFDSLIKVTGEIKTGYNPNYAFNRKTLATLRLLKDASNRYIWESGNLGVDAPSSINGASYVLLPDMPDIGAGTFPVIFGDFKNFMIGDRKSLTVFRDESTGSKLGLITYVFHRRVGCVVAKPESFKKIKISA